MSREKKIEFHSQPMPDHRGSTLITRFLDTVGNGTGSIDATGDYSSVAQEFKITPADDEVYCISRLIVHVKDTQGIDADSYGNNITLTNGITIKTVDSGGDNEIFVGSSSPIMVNADWGKYCYDVNVLTFGAGNETCVVRWTFSKYGGHGCWLHGFQSESFVITLNDNFTGLLSHGFVVEGFML